MDQYRDAGPYSARNSSKGALIAEAGTIVDALRSGLSTDQARARAISGDLITQRARSTRERVWDAIHYMYLSQPTWGLADLQAAYERGPQSREFLSLLYVHYALRDHLTFDFVAQVLWARWNTHQLAVAREDVLDLLDQASEAQPQIQRWAEGTRIKLAGSILTALRDFGVLAGKQKKTIVQPVLPLTTAEHLLRILVAEGIRGADVLRDPAWRLSFYREEDVARTLGQLAQERRIAFERVGSTVVLETPGEWSEP